MDVQELRDYFAETLSFPVTLDTVLSEVGSTTVEAPDADDTTTIQEILGDLDSDTYETPDELFTMVQSSLPEAYVGTKFYSDRGGYVDEMDEDPTDA